MGAFAAIDKWQSRERLGFGTDESEHRPLPRGAHPSCATHHPPRSAGVRLVHLAIRRLSRPETALVAGEMENALAAARLACPRTR